MSSPRVSSIPRIVPRRLAAPGSLAEVLLARPDLGVFPRPPGTRPRVDAATGSEARLPASAIRLTTPGAEQRFAEIRAGRGVAVTTGQQPGLFLGPLLTLYKAITAVRVAETIERESGVPALALFWAASDDHDWDEVAVCRVIGPGPDEEVRTLRLDPPPGREGRGVGTSPLPDTVGPLVDQLRELLRGGVTGTPPRWIDDLANAYRPGRTFGEAFVDALASAFAGVDVAILDSGHPDLRQAAAPLYEQVVRDRHAVIGAMATGRESVERLGFSPALTPPTDGLQIFRDEGTGRVHLRDDAGFDARAVLRELERAPEAFTPAAALRPVLESWLLPVAAAVLGPGELAYWAQLAPLFAALDVEMPAVVPRDAWTLVEPPVDRLLEKLDVTVAEVEGGGPELEQDWVRAHRPLDVATGISEARSGATGAIDAIAAAIDRELPGLRSSVGMLGHRWHEALAEFERTVDAAVRMEENLALSQFGRLRTHLAPEGVPQERVVGAAQALGHHGTALVGALLDASRVAASGDPD